MRGVPRTAFAPSNCCVSGLNSGGSGHHCTCAAWLNSLLPPLSNHLCSYKAALEDVGHDHHCQNRSMLQTATPSLSYSSSLAEESKASQQKIGRGQNANSTKAKTGFSRALLAPNPRHSTTLSNPLYLHTAPSGASALAYTKAHTSLSEAVAAVWMECKPKSFGSCVWRRQNSNPNPARPQPWFSLPTDIDRF